jgi:tripartite-type tricarboxylate transporter receptor subunit TctC
MQGELHLPDYVFSRPEATATASSAFPHKAITMIVPTRAGGGNDMMARIIAARLGPLLGCEVLVDNRAGANGAIASEYVAHAEPDGHTILFGYVGTHAMNPALQKLGYDPIADFAPIGLVGSSPTLMVGHPGKAPPDVATLIADLRYSPRRYAYASAGDGTPPHFAAELFQLSSATAMASATYEGAAPAMADTVAGRAQIMFPSLFTAHPFLQAGQLRALAVTGPKRLAGLQGVPTLAEVGVTGVDVAQWYGLFAPAGTPQVVVDKLNRVLNEVLADPQVIERFRSHGAQVEPGPPDVLSLKVKSELARWSEVVQQARLEPHESRLATLD